MKLPKDATIYPLPSAFNEKELDFICHAIGFEISKEYYEKSLEYIKNETSQTNIFQFLEG